MIPKIIHYCWFGGNPLPDDVKAYIDTWRRHLPDFEIRQWDESNFEVNALEYTRQAYYAHRYAFVSDVARLYALTEFGGLYFDTDILLKKPLPAAWFDRKVFTSFEHDRFVQTGILASEPHHPLFEAFYEQYKNRKFFLGLQYDLTTNVSHLTALMVKAGFVMNNQFQERDGIALYPQELLCGKDWQAGRYDTDETIAVHDFQGGWANDVLHHKLRFYRNMIGTIVKWHLRGKNHKIKM